jgi:hypothetical protein
MRSALDCSAALIVANAATALRFSLSGSEGFDPEPWVHWDMPVLHEKLDPDRGPIVVDVEYRIDPVRAAEFERAMSALETIRRRDGAVAWGIFADATDPSRYFEMFMVETSGEHLR